MRPTGPRASQEERERKSEWKNEEAGGKASHWIRQGKKKVFNTTIVSSTMFLHPSQGAAAKVLFPRDFRAFSLFLFL